MLSIIITAYFRSVFYDLTYVLYVYEYVQNQLSKCKFNVIGCHKPPADSGHVQSFTVHPCSFQSIADNLYVGRILLGTLR